MGTSLQLLAKSFVGFGLLSWGGGGKFRVRLRPCMASSGEHSVVLSCVVAFALTQPRWQRSREEERVPGTDLFLGVKGFGLTSQPHLNPHLQTLKTTPKLYVLARSLRDSMSCGA